VAVAYLEKEWERQMFEMVRSWSDCLCFLSFGKKEKERLIVTLSLTSQNVKKYLAGI